MSLYDALVLGINFAGTKAIIVYIVVIVAIIAVALYARGNAVRR